MVVMLILILNNNVTINNGRYKSVVSNVKVRRASNIIFSDNRNWVIDSNHSRDRDKLSIYDNSDVIEIRNFHGSHQVYRRYRDITTDITQQTTTSIRCTRLHLTVTILSRYHYCKHNKVTFLWAKLSDLNIKVDIQGAWGLAKQHPHDVFIMEKIIDKGYPVDILRVFNDARVYMNVVVFSDILMDHRIKMTKWAWRGEVNCHHKWV